MGKVTDGGSIPYYNKAGELIASYNTFYNVLYYGLKITEEEKAEILAKVQKKKKALNITIMESIPRQHKEEPVDEEPKPVKKSTKKQSSKEASSKTTKKGSKKKKDEK